jgi:hypothetical protein
VLFLVLLRFDNALAEEKQIYFKILDLCKAYFKDHHKKDEELEFNDEVVLNLLNLPKA